MSDYIKRLRVRRDAWSLNGDSARVSVRLGDLRRALDDVEGMEQALTRAGARLDILAMYVPKDKSAVVAGWAEQARQALSAPNTEEGEASRELSQSTISQTGPFPSDHQTRS